MLRRMCCFSRSVSSVGATKIFARGLDPDHQVLVYAMNVALDEELAMILPLPVPPAPADDAVTFITLEGEESFFGQLARAFPPLGAPAARQAFAPPAKAQPLEVVDVGQYEASFVPTPTDFNRLDARFRLPGGFLEALPGYADYAFAVFRLKPAARRAKPQNVQPMAFRFPRREPRALFFPTVHVHDGHVPQAASFDHTLFCQADGLLEATLGWTASTSALGAHVQGAQSLGVVDAERGGFATSIWGTNANEDVWLREPAEVTLAELRGDGECYAFELAASAMHAFGHERAARPAWSETASRRLPALCRGLRQGLAELTARRRQAWHLTQLTPDAPAHFMNGHQLWSGTDYRDGRPASPGGAGRVRFSPFSERVQPQSISLGFAELPSQEEALAINAELCRLLDRALDA